MRPGAGVLQYLGEECSQADVVCLPGLVGPVIPALPRGVAHVGEDCT